MALSLSREIPSDTLFSPAIPLRISSSSIFSRLKFRWHSAKDGDSKEPRPPRPFCQKFQNLESLVPLRLGSEQLQNDIGYWATSRPFTMRCSGRSLKRMARCFQLNTTPPFLDNCFLPDSAPPLPIACTILLSFSLRDDSFDPAISFIRGKYSPSEDS